MRLPRFLICCLAVILALALACKSDKSSTGKPDKVPGAVGDSSAGPASLPEPMVPVLKGTQRPAPWLEGATALAVATRGDKVWIAAGGVGDLRLFAPDGTLLRRIEVPGTAQRLLFVDLDGDGIAELVGGWGIGVATRDAKVALKVFRGADLSEVVDIDVGSTTRHQVVDFAVGEKQQVVIAHFVTKYIVALSRLMLDAKSLQPGKRVRMVGGLAVATPKGASSTLAIARVYGDELNEPGLVQIYDKDQLVTLPSLRGARAIRWSDKDQALVVADGWHRKYAAEAKALISKLAWSGGKWQRVVLANVKGRHGYVRIALGDIDGDGVTDAVAAGNGPAVAVSLGSDGTSPALSLGGGEASDVAVHDLDGDGRSEVVIVGSEPVIWSIASP